MKILENYNKAIEELNNYFEIDNIDYYPIDISDHFFNVGHDTLGWAETEEDLESEDGDYYSADTKLIVEKEELTLVLVDSDFGDGSYWIIFDNKNRRNYE